MLASQNFDFMKFSFEPTLRVREKLPELMSCNRRGDVSNYPGFCLSLHRSVIRRDVERIIRVVYRFKLDIFKPYIRCLECLVVYKCLKFHKDLLKML